MNVQEMLAEFTNHAREMKERNERFLDALEEERQALSGIKPVRLPVVSKTAANPFTMGGDAAQPQQCPAPGFVWSILHWVIEGLAGGATPDVLTASTRGRIMWSFAGVPTSGAPNNVATFGRGAMLLWPGETITYNSVGTFASTALIVAHGLAEEVPAEMIGKFY